MVVLVTRGQDHVTVWAEVPVSRHALRVNPRALEEAQQLMLRDLAARPGIALITSSIRVELIDRPRELTVTLRATASAFLVDDDDFPSPPPPRSWARGRHANPRAHPQ